MKLPPRARGFLWLFGQPKGLFLFNALREVLCPGGAVPAIASLQVLLGPDGGLQVLRPPDQFSQVLVPALGSEWFGQDFMLSAGVRPLS